MTNIKNYNFTGIDFRVSNSEYYDFYLNTDALKTHINSSGINPILSFNFSGLTSLPQSGLTNEELWDDTQTPVSGLTATTYGLTGLDNGAIFYDPANDTFDHQNLIDKLTGTTLTISSGSTNFIIDNVSGYTGTYEYPLELVTTTAMTGNYINFCGGFYQGYYKLDGYDYQTLPTRYQKGWSIETWMNKSDSVCSGVTATTLNDTYPDNKGFFFYHGTRAENKFWNIFTGNTTGCTSGSTDFCTEVKETDVNINNIKIEGSGTTVSVPLAPPPVDVSLIKNQFLIFGRSDGLLCSNEESPTGFGQTKAGRNYKREPFYATIVRVVPSLSTNPFLIFGRSDGLLCSNEESPDGYGQVKAGRDFSGTTKPVTELDKNADLNDNALGFRVRDDGSIGYRLLTLSADCKSIEVVEEYSTSGVISNDQWQHIVVKWVNNDTYNECDLENGEPRKGRFKFYVNSNLIFVSKLVNELVPRRLDDLLEKQVSVPYNISIGGGTQGLLESMTFDGQDPDDLGLLIEKNFAGSFIGSMSLFKLYEKGLNWCEVKDLYKQNLSKFQ